MAHGVEDGEGEDVAVEAVVEGVAAHVVGRFQDPGQGDVGGPERQRGQQQVPLHLGRQAHGLAAPALLDRVGVLVGGADQVADQAPQVLAQLDGVVGEAIEAHFQDTDAFCPLPDGGPGGPPGLGLGRDHFLELEGPARHGAGHLHLTGVGGQELRAECHRAQGLLLVVDQVEDQVAAPHLAE